MIEIDECVEVESHQLKRSGRQNYRSTMKKLTMKKMLPETLSPRARLFYLAGILMSVALIAFGLSLLLPSSTGDSNVPASRQNSSGKRLPSVETSIPTYSPSTHGGTVPPKTIDDAPTDFPSNEQSSATPTEQIKNLRGDTPAPSEDPSHAPTASPEESSTKPSASSSGEPSLFRSAPPSEQQSENPSESPTAQPTTLHPSTVQPTTSQPTLSSSPTQTIEPLFPDYNASASAYFNYNLTKGARYGPSAWDRVTVPADNYWSEFLGLEK